MGKAKDQKDWNFDPVFNKSVENLKASVILRILVCLPDTLVLIQSAKLCISIGQTFDCSKLNHIHGNLTFVQTSSLLLIWQSQSALTILLLPIIRLVCKLVLQEYNGDL